MRWWYDDTVREDETRQTIRLPDKLLARMRVMAEADHRSVHSLMLAYIERGLAADERRVRRAATMEARP
jgi:hypothetical protein